jgi:hypothetical protein
MSEKLEPIVKELFHLVLSIKLYHWRTTSLSRHRASDELWSQILASMDKFVEDDMAE